MSGICGIVHFDAQPPDHASLYAMVDAARHRAPDGVGVWTGDGCAMAQLNTCFGLAATPPCQPCQSLDGRFVIAGDIHLHDREALQAALATGNRGSGNHEPAGCLQCTDADLVLRAYLHWGDECLGRLIGDYAFVIWDRRDRRLFAARDPMGMRPLYYHCSDRYVLFASEIGQVLATGRVSRRLNRSMAAAWLAVRAGDPAWTFFDGIAQLPGAYSLNADEHGARVVRCWDIDPERRIVYRSEDEYVDHLRQLLLTATRARLEGAVPAGMFLSGGLDSCVVAGAAGWLLEHERALASEQLFTTFSCRYEEFPECDERYVSEPLAKHWGMRIEEFSSDAWRTHDLIERAWNVDSPVVSLYQPLIDAALDRARSLGIRRIFCADRGDNMVGVNIWDHVGLLLSGALAETWRELRRYRAASRRGFWQTAQQSLVRPTVFAMVARFRLLARLREWRQARLLEDRRKHGRLAAPWVSASLLREIDLPTVFGTPDRKGFKSAPSYDRHAAVFFYFSERIYVQSERRTAQFGLHYEDPWSDRRILEFVCAVPQHVLNRVDDTKRLARRALTGLVPVEVQTAARKIIPAPFGLHALRVREAASLKALTKDMRAAQAGLLDEACLADNITSFLEGADLDSGAWAAVVLEAWLRYNNIEA